VEKLFGVFAKDGRRVVLRALSLFNSLVEEGAEIIRNEKVSKEEEIDWLSKTQTGLFPENISKTVNT
jgi:hypothetical protein